MLFSTVTKSQSSYFFRVRRKQTLKNRVIKVNSNKFQATKKMESLFVEYESLHNKTQLMLLGYLSKSLSEMVANYIYDRIFASDFISYLGKRPVFRGLAGLENTLENIQLHPIDCHGWTKMSNSKRTHYERAIRVYRWLTGEEVVCSCLVVTSIAETRLEARRAEKSLFRQMWIGIRFHGLKKRKKRKYGVLNKE